MEHPFIYTGWFTDPAVLYDAVRGIRTDPLEREIAHPHITSVFRPQQVDRSLFGLPIKIRMIAYGNDGSNEGVLVQAASDDARMTRLLSQIAVPHITLAVSADGKPVNTGKLTFRQIEPIEIIGIYGGFSQNGEVIITPQ